MLSKCANPACSTPFRRLREGKLFQVETECWPQAKQPAARLVSRRRPWRRVEHYWLCDQCSFSITLTFDRERGMIAVPLPGGSSPMEAFVFLGQAKAADANKTIPLNDHRHLQARCNREA